MYYFFYGPNTFSIKEKVKEIEAKFKQVPGWESNFLKLYGSTLTPDAYSTAVFGTSFFGDKKLVEIINLIQDNSSPETRKYISDTLEKIPKSCVIIFIEEGVPDQRTAIFKKLNQPKQAQNFPLLRDSEVTIWVRSALAANQKSITAEAMQRLIGSVGSDLSRLKNEIDKICLYADGQKKGQIELGDVLLLVEPNPVATVFDLSNAISNRDTIRALSFLRILRENEADSLKVFFFLVSHFRTLMVIDSLRQKGLSGNLIAKASGCHPYVVQKAIQALGRHSFSELKQVYGEMARFDAALKSGEAEAGLPLELLVVELCQSCYNKPKSKVVV